MLPLISTSAGALPGDLGVIIGLDDDELLARPTEDPDTVIFHGNVSFDQPFYQRATASLTTSADKNWTVALSTSQLTHRGTGDEPFNVLVTVPPSALGREVATVTITAEYSTRLGTSQTTSVTATVRVASWVGYWMNVSRPLELVLDKGSSGTLDVPLENVGNEAEYFSALAPFWYGLKRYGITVDTPSNVLVTAHGSTMLPIDFEVGPDTEPRAYRIDLEVDAKSLLDGGSGPMEDPREIEVHVFVTGEPSSGSQYTGWSKGDGPQDLSDWQPFFGSSEFRMNPDIDAAGRYIVFDQFRGQERSIYIGEANGSGARRLTRGHIDHHPVISPDGQRIAFARAPDRVVVIDTNGTAIVEIGTDLGDVNLTDWSPLGDRLLLDAGYNVYELDINVNMTRLLAGDPVNQWGAVYAPSGVRIYYLSYEAAGRRPEVWSMSSDGSDHTQLTFNDYVEVSVSVSPNGERVAFVLQEDGANGHMVCVMDTEGEGVRYFSELSRFVHMVRWLPDGSGLVAEVFQPNSTHHDINRIDYPWADAGFRPDDGNGGGGDNGGGGGDRLSDILGPLAFLFEPLPCAVIILVVVVTVTSGVYVHQRGRRREESAQKLKEVTGREASVRPEVLIVEPQLVEDYHSEYGMGYRRYEGTRPKPPPAPLPPRIVRNRR